MLRRSVDILAAATALVVLGPVLIVIALTIRLTSSGPALFTQQRVGIDRKCFRLFKFRTMLVGTGDADLRAMIASELRGENACQDGSWKLAGDHRVTRVGSFLRRTSLDELPQLLNVLLGDMTLVGPRPCLEWEAEMFPSRFDARFGVQPGLTGLWQVSGRSTVGTLDMLRMDVHYARNRSLALDATIIARTFPVLLRGDGAR